MSAIAISILSIVFTGLFCAGFRKASDYRVIRKSVPAPKNSPEQFIVTEQISDKMLLWKLRYLLLKLDWYGKPLGTCIYCMPSFYGSIIYFTFTILYSYHPLSIHTLVFWILSVFSSVVASGYFYSKIND